MHEQKTCSKGCRIGIQPVENNKPEDDYQQTKQYEKTAINNKAMDTAPVDTASQAGMYCGTEGCNCVPDVGSGNKFPHDQPMAV